MIRVISGIYKGKRLKKVPSPCVRPMPDKLKSALFNILRDEVKGTVILDGFAGTGSIGIEALSRGAQKAVFIEEDFRAVSVIKHNIEKIGAGDNVRILPKEFNRAVIQLEKKRPGSISSSLILPIGSWMRGIPLKSLRREGFLGRAASSSSAAISKRSSMPSISRFGGRSPSATTPYVFIRNSASLFSSLFIPPQFSSTRYSNGCESFWQGERYTPSLSFRLPQAAKSNRIFSWYSPNRDRVKSL